VSIIDFLRGHRTKISNGRKAQRALQRSRRKAHQASRRNDFFAALERMRGLGLRLGANRPQRWNGRRFVTVACSLAAALLLTGCLAPANSIRIGPASIRAPKDVVLEGLTVDIQTNGAVQITVDKLSSTNNPQVIDSSAAGTVSIIRATKDAILDAAAKPKTPTP
jgi:hypothetical protein